MSRSQEIKAYFPCVGLGVGAKGFQRARVRAGKMIGHYRVIGGVDNDARVVANAQAYVGAPLTQLDLFSRAQYTAFHGAPPPDGWREATPADIRRSAGYEFPNVIFTSFPCKGYSGLTSEARSMSPKYQALNELFLRGVFLILEAFAENPPEFWLMENVPRILTRGAHLLELMRQLLASYGYAIATPPNLIHDCGELGGLAQSRKRFLLIARHQEKVPNFLYQPLRKPLRAVGDVLSRLPLPDHASAGPLHRLPSLSWKTWVRLAFVEAGKDWRSLNRLAVEEGYLRDYALAPETAWHNGAMGVQEWDKSTGAVIGSGRPGCGTFSVADPVWRPANYDCQQYGVLKMEETAPTVRGGVSPGQGSGFAVADVRFPNWAPGAHENKFRVLRYEGTAGAVTGTNRGPGGGAGCVADVRLPDTNPNRQNGLYRVVRWEGYANGITGAVHAAGGAQGIADVRPGWHRHQNALQVAQWGNHAGAIIGGGKGVHGGWQSVSDPRPTWERGKQSEAAFIAGGHFGVLGWSETAKAVTGGRYDNGFGSVADIRLPDADERLRCLIVAEDGTWHRPFTTMENAALQSIFDPEEYMHFSLFGASDQVYREWIGNAAPRDAMTAVAEVIGQALLLAWNGETHITSDTPIWVQPIIAAIQCGDTTAA